jgi:hypothetical protein
VGQFKQPDFTKGDPNTIGGYAAAHDRPAAFEGSDGFSYSVELMAAEDGGGAEPWGAFVFFVRWARVGASSPEGHLESDVLVRGATQEQALERLGALPLNRIKAVLDELIARAPGGAPKRKWWDAMRDPDESDEHR